MVVLEFIFNGNPFFVIFNKCFLSIKNISNNFALLTLGIIFFSQACTTIEVTVQKQQLEIGRNHITNKPLEAVEYNFPKRVHDFHFDTTNQLLTVNLRGLSKNGKWLDNKGIILRYDLRTDSILWYKKITYQKESIDQYGGVTIHSSRNKKSHSIDNYTGEQLWEIKNNLLFGDTKYGIGIGYKINSRINENTLEGIDLKSGNVLWKRDISREYGWNGILIPNDSTLFILASGLNKLNINDGTGWSFKTVTGEKDYSAARIGSILGVMSGLMTGYYSISTGYNLVKNVNSNALFFDDTIFFASKDDLVSLAGDGTIIWKASLPSDKMSRSLIFRLDSNLILINRGFSYMGNRQIKYGTPFIASYCLDTGSENYFIDLAPNNEDIIRSIQHQDHEILLVFNQRVLRYSLKTGELLTESFFKSDFIGSFIGDYYYQSLDSKIFSLNQIEPNKYYLSTTDDKVLILNHELKIEKKLTNKDFYHHLLKTEHLDIITKDGQVLVVDKNGNIKAEFTSKRTISYLEGILHSIDGSRLIQIKLNEVAE